VIVMNIIIFENFFKKSNFSFPYKDIRVQVGAVLLACGFILAAWYFLTANIQTTNNATVQCDVIDITTEVKGIVSSINFNDDQMIERDQILVNIEPTMYAARLRKSEADLEMAKLAHDVADYGSNLVSRNANGNFEQSKDSLAAMHATAEIIKFQIVEAKSAENVAQIELDLAKSNFEKIQKLYDKKIISKAQFDDSLSTYEAKKSILLGAQAKVAAAQGEFKSNQALIAEISKKSALFGQSEQDLTMQAIANRDIGKSKIKAAQAERDLAALDLDRTRIRSLRKGIITDRHVGVGQLIDVGQPIARVVACTENSWVVANFKETQVGRMKNGQQAKITIDAYPGKTFSGSVESISAGSGASFSLLPAENATGNFTKIVKRIPVKIKIDDPSIAIMRVGMSVAVSVYEN
jgi:membrane fusion protein, multidrug efflux system